MDLNKRGPPPPVSFKTKLTIVKKPDNKQDYLKVDIRTHTWEINSKVVSFYIPIFSTGLDESLLKFLFLLNKILKG